MSKPTTDTVLHLRQSLDAAREALAEAREDQTLAAAREALAEAQQAKEAADAEDFETDPAELVDRRMAAGRNFEIAKIRVERAERDFNSRLSRASGMVTKVATDTRQALLAIIEPFRENLRAGLNRVVGEMFKGAHDQAINGIVFSTGNHISAICQTLHSVSLTPHPQQAIPTVERGIDMLEDALRER